jgi:peptidoglycan/xylan/chitin deacetylase (PgdA/CDA1 family)
VLCYHGVNDVAEADDPLHLVVSPALLEEHVGWLRGRGYGFLTAEDLLDRTGGCPPPARYAVLTFDDGWADALSIVVPLLARLGVRATFYVNPGRWAAQHPDVAGSAGRLLDEKGARALHAAGHELGSHAMTHPDLRLLDDRRLDWELVEAKATLERVTGRPCRTLAYPFGLFDARVEAAARRAGYELAFGWLPGRWRRPSAAPRLPAPPRHGARRLALKVHGVRLPESAHRALTRARA